MQETNPIADRIVSYRWEQKGLERGIEKGIEKGRAEGVRSAPLRLVTERGWTPTSEQLQRLSSCSDADRLTVWLDRLFAGLGLDEALAG